MSDCQVIVCKCGSQIAGCWEPHCYEDRDWLKNIRDYTLKGYLIKMVSSPSLSECKCK